MLLFFFHETEFRVVFSSSEVLGREFREFASIFVQRNRIPSCFLFRGRVRNGIPRFYVPRNSRNSGGNNHLFRLFRLPRNYFFGRKYPTLIVTAKRTLQDPPLLYSIFAKANSFWLLQHLFFVVKNVQNCKRKFLYFCERYGQLIK